MAPQLSSDEIGKLSHSPVHHAVARRDYVALRRLTLSVPKLGKAGDIKTESDAIAEECRAEALSAVLDRRDVPGRETALHLAVRMGDATAAEILMAAGIDWSLQNEQGWNALQEAICAKEEAIAMVIMRYHQPMAWAKWCRRLPRLVGTMQRMRDFYMELTFHFESSVIPFIGKVAPSDTYRIWKRGCNLRADMTLAGFDGFKIQRCDQSFLFLGEGSEDGLIPPGSLCLLNHKDREIMNASALASSELSEVEIAQEVALMSQTNLYRPGLDVTRAELFPQLSWRRQEKTEMVGPWKAKVYDMHHVTISLKSRKVPGSMTDNELFGIGKVEREDGYLEDLTDSLTEEEKQQLEAALSINSVETDPYARRSRKPTNMADVKRVDCSEDDSPYAFEFEENPSEKGGKKGWLGWGKQSSKQSCVRKVVPGRSSLCIDEKVSNLLGDEAPCEEHFPKGSKCHRGHRWVENRRFSDFRPDESYHDVKKLIYEEHSRKRRVSLGHEGRGESEYKKGLRPVLWLTPSFPLKTEELLPLLDILADKVKAVRRLRELLTTKLPAAMFPVKMAIPVVPTVRVIVTFTKFEGLQSENEEFSTPSSSPGHTSNVTWREARQSSTSWLSWVKGATGRVAGLSDAAEDRVRCTDDPFVIPTGYAWTSMDAKKKGSKDKKPRRKGLKYGQAGVDPPDISNGQDRCLLNSSVGVNS